jgi:hypothetical protein
LYKKFVSCEAAAMAELNGEYDPTNKEALIVGSYIHAWSEGVLDAFKQQNAGFIYNKKGEPYAAYKKADEMINVLSKDEYCMMILQGAKEIILTAEFAGTMWKAKIDVLNEDNGYFVDLKTTRSIMELQWSEKLHRRVSFIDQYDYMIQAAVYAEIERLASGRSERLKPLMVAVSKEDPPDKAVISLDDKGRLKYELEQIKYNMPRILEVRAGIEEAINCGRCPYCRQVKKVQSMISYKDLTPAG